MAKLPVSINGGGGGNSGPVKNRIYERKKVVDALLGVKTTKKYRLKRSGINQYNNFPNSNYYSIASGSGFSVYYAITDALTGSDLDTIALTRYDKMIDQYGTYYLAYYVISEDKWYKKIYNTDLSAYEFVVFEEADYEDLLIGCVKDGSYTFPFSVYAAGLFINIITNEDGSEFMPKEYKYINTTVEEHNMDLRNWFYEYDEWGLLRRPNWDLLDQLEIEPDSSLNFYYDEYNGIFMSLYKTTNGYYSLTIGHEGRDETLDYGYFITNDPSYIGVTNEWYSLPSHTDIDGKPTDISLDPDEWIDGESQSVIETLYNAFFGYGAITLDDKLNQVVNYFGNAIEIERNRLLKTKTYDYVKSNKDLVDEQTYKFKEDCSDFFEKYNSSQTGVIYSLQASANPKSQTRDKISAEIVTFIEYAGFNGGGGQISYDVGAKGGGSTVRAGGAYYISVVTTNNEYRFYADSDGWSTMNSNSLPPDLVFNSSAVINMEMLRDILDLTVPQTLEEKFAEPIINRNYEEKSLGNKVTYDLSTIFVESYYNLLDENGLMPNSNNHNIGYYNDLYLYDDPENKVRLKYIAYGGYYAGEHTNTFIWEFYDENEDTIYSYEGGMNTLGSEPEWGWTHWEFSDGYSYEVVTSQLDMPTINFKASNMLDDYDPEIVAKLFTEISVFTTLGEKIKDLPNWEYKTKTVKDMGTKPIFEMNKVLMKLENPLYDAGLLENQTDTLIYSNMDEQNADDLKITYSYYYGYGSGVIRLVWYVPNYEEEYYEVYESYIEFSDFSNLPEPEWHHWEQPFSANQYDAFEASRITEQADLPNIAIDSNFITSGFENIVPLLYSEDVTVKVSLKEKFATCLTLERLTNVEIDQTAIDTNTYQEYLTDYPYMVEVQNEAFKNALKVDVVFTLAQLDSGNICSLQEIDTENGVMTLFLKTNNGNIILNRVDIFKFNVDEEETPETEQAEQEEQEPIFEPIAGQIG